MATLEQAHFQWAKRAPDERFGSVADMHAAALSYRQNAATAKTNLSDMRAHVLSTGDVGLIGKAGAETKLTHWAFGQLATRAEAPASYLRSLSADLAVKCINEGLDGQTANPVALLLDRSNGLTTRALTSDRYERIWNVDITSRLLDLQQGGIWQPAPAAFDGSRGLYLSDQDMFAFMVDSDRRIFETLPGGGLSRGFFMWNSEVGATSFGLATVLYEYVCGNHRVWGAKMLGEVRLRHVGDVHDRAFVEIEQKLFDYANSSIADDEAKITSARNFVLGKDKDAVLDALFAKLRGPAVTKKLLGASYDLATEREGWYGAPNTAWGMAGAITEIARDKANGSERDAINRVGAKVMELAF